jgi:hypothetical protein
MCYAIRAETENEDGLFGTAIMLQAVAWRRPRTRRHRYL